MSFLSSIIIPAIEKQLAADSPEIATELLKSAARLGQAMIDYVETKIGFNPIEEEDDHE